MKHNTQPFRRGKAVLALAGVIIMFAALVAGAALYTGGRMPSAISPEKGQTRTEPRAFVMHDAPRPLPEIAFEDVAGRPLTLAGFEGKTILLNIWATWCGPCREEMPTLDNLQAKLGGGDFQVLALSIDRAGPEVVRKFYDGIGIRHLELYIDPSTKISPALGVVGLPTTLLIDAGGRELGRLVGPAEWDTPEMVAFLKSHVASN